MSVIGQLFVGSYSASLPLVTNLSVPVTYKNADIREPDKRNASFSKTIQIPGSNEVNKFFEKIYRVNIKTGVFNPNKKEPARYLTDGKQTFNGSLQLIKVTIKPDGSLVYECNVIGEAGNIFLDMGDALLSDLDFSEYDHAYTRDYQIGSWNNECVKNGIYTSLPTGQGYYYGFVHRGTNGGSDNVFNVKDFLPSFYVREYLDKIFTAQGYTWTSNFLDSSEFKQLTVYPNIDNIALSQSQLDDRQWYVGLNTDYAVTLAALTTLNCPNESGSFFDLGGQLSGTVATLNNNGYYNLAASLKVQFSFTHTDASVHHCSFNSLAPQFQIAIKRSTDGGATYSTIGVNTLNFYPSSPGGPFEKGKNYYSTLEVATGEMLFNAGDKFKVYFILSYSGLSYYTASNVLVSIGTGTPVFKLRSGNNMTSFYGLVTQKVAAEGSVIEVNNALPKNIKQKDFFKSIIQGFNLFIDYDKSNPKNLIIEPYTDFYTGVEDWSNLVDYSKDISVDPLFAIDGKTYIYKYKDDKDYYNQSYFDTHSQVFGTKKVEVDNDFLKAEKKNELIFSPSPFVANLDLGIPQIKIFKKEDLQIKPLTPNIRLLYAGGVMNTANSYTYKEQAQPDITTNEYGYIGHCDDPLNPTVDYNFGTPLSLFYTFVNAYYTNNNLYNRFHKDWLNNLINRDAKFITCSMWLSPRVMANFNFRTKKFVRINDEGAYYIVNQIKDYDPTRNESTQVELIKVFDPEPFTPTSTNTSSDPTLPTGIGNESFRLNSSLTLGQNVVNKGTNCIAVGDNIFIPATASNVTVIGSNVVVAENVSNVSAINTSNVELTESNQSINNNVNMLDYFIDGYQTTTSNAPSEITFNTVNGLFDMQGIDVVIRAEIRLLAVDTATGDCKEWKGAKLFKNISGITSTSNIEALTSTVADASMTGCTASFADDPTPPSIECAITGLAATTIDWKCYVNFIKIVI